MTRKKFNKQIDCLINTGKVRPSLINMNATQATKVSRSVALDKDVAEKASRAAKKQNRSFSNYVETLLAEELKKGGKR